MKKITFFTYLLLCFFCDYINAQFKTFHTNGQLKEIGNYDQSGKKTGVWTKYFPSGNTYSLHIFNKEKGWNYVLFYDNGNIRKSGNYNDKGRKYGEWLSYDKEGCLTTLETIENGAYVGERRLYHMNKLTAIQHYKDRKKTGKWISYQSGKLKEIKNYVNDKLHGENKSFFDNDSLSFERYYNHGTAIGEHKEFYKSGQLKEHIVFNNGKKHFKKNYDKNGILRNSNVFEDDKILAKSFYEGSIGFKKNKYNHKKHEIGKWKYYHFNGQLHYKGNYDTLGKRTGKWKYYHENGKRKSTVIFSNNIKQGDYKSWYRNGKIKEKGSYTKDQKVGIWNYYDDDGKKSAYQQPNKGVIKGKISNLPDGEKLNNVAIMLTPYLFFDQSLDSLGNFTSKEIDYGIYSFQVFKGESYYPILIRNVHINSPVIDLGNLPLFKEPFGYLIKQGELVNGNDTQFKHRNAIYDKRRDSIENSYKLLFKKSFPKKELKFKAINISTDTNKNTSHTWLFSVIKNKEE